MTIDTDKLKALALAATPGPWEWASDWDRAAVYSTSHKVPQEGGGHSCKRVVCSGNQNNSGRWSAEHWSGSDWSDAKYIAAANPATVLELIAEVERLRADAQRYRWLREKAPDRICAIAWITPAACHYAEPDEAIDAAIEAHTRSSKEQACGS